MQLGLVILLTGSLLGEMQITAYRSVPQNTDSSPFYTSIGEHVCKDGVAVSQDLLHDKIVKYGDWLYIEGVGLKRVNDTMNKRFNNSLDVWVNTLKEEQQFYKKFKGKKVKVWILRQTIQQKKETESKLHLKNQ